MAYKISGDLDRNADIIVIDQATWSVELINNTASPDEYALASGISTGTKIVFGRSKESGKVLAYGNVAPVYESSPLSGDVGVFGGGSTNEGATFSMSYINIPVSSNSLEFGDLSSPRYWLGATSNGSSNRGVWAGGVSNSTSSELNLTDYVSLASTGVASVFGQLTEYRSWISAMSNKANNRGVFCGGTHEIEVYPNDVLHNTIDYITISTTGNAQDFGDTATVLTGFATASNSTLNRGIIAGGQSVAASNTFINTIQYVTISSASSAQDFGGLITAKKSRGAVDNGTNDRALFMAGFAYDEGFIYLNTIEYITVSTTGNSTDFGDMAYPSTHVQGVSNGTGNEAVFSLYHEDYTWYETVNISSTGNSVESSYWEAYYLTPDVAAATANA